MRTVAAQWESYEKAVVPADAGALQRQESKRAFYAGAHGLLSVLRSMADEGVSDAAAAGILEGLQAETIAFSQTVLRGDA